MPTPKIIDIGSVVIDDESYRLVRLENRQQSYVHGFEDEPPYQGGAPSLISDPTYTWHLGGLKSRPGIPGTSEYGKNSDGRWAFRLLPSAKINNLTLTSSASNPSSIFEALGYVFVVCGRRVYRIDPATDTVVLSKDFGGGGALGVMGLRWEEDFALVTTDEASNSLYKLASGGIVVGGPDTWTQTSDVSAYRMAAGINRLFKITKTGELSNVSTSLDPMDATQYADEVQCGETATLPTALLSYQRTVFVGKPEGLYGVGDDGFGFPMINRMARDADNCYGMNTFDPYVLVPHVRGLYRFVPGDVVAAGLEKELLNESPIQGRWKGFAMDSEWVYGLLAVGSETYVMVGRDRRGGESGFGPYVWDTWLHFAGTSKAVWLSALTSPPRLWFGNGNNISYVELADGPGAVEYATSAQRFSFKYRFDDRHQKDFPKLDIEGEDVDDDCYWAVYYSVDGAAFSNLDAAGNAMRVDSVGLHTFYLPTTAVGAEVQFRLDYTSNDDEQAGAITYMEPYAAPQSRKAPVIMFHLQLEEGTMHDEEREERTAVEQFNDLIALSEQAAAVVTTGPWGEDVNAWLRRVRIVETTQEGDGEAAFLVECAMQLRESS